MTDADLQAAASELVFEVMGLEMPMPANPTPSGGSGHYWRVDVACYHDLHEPLHVAIAYWWDLWRRTQVSRPGRRARAAGRAGPARLGGAPLRVGAVPRGLGAV